MTPKRITIHCSATPNGLPYSAAQIRRFHTSPPPAGRGWKDIAYHRIIQPDGTIEQGRPFNVQGAHVGDMGGDLFDCNGQSDNAENLGVCIVGTDKYPLCQLEALRRDVLEMQKVFGIPDWEVRCHNQFRSAQAQGKSCPGIEIGRLLLWIVTGNLDAIATALIASGNSPN